jgi:hypothetical protein
MISLLYALGSDCDCYSGGAMWKVANSGMTHWTSGKKIALATDARVSS